MRFRSLFGWSEPGSVPVPVPEPVPAPVREVRLTPEELEELRAAWRELTSAASEAGVTGFRACSRTGAPWELSPSAVREITAIIRSEFPVSGREA